MQLQKPTLVSMFSGALGLDLGLEKSGFETQAVAECDTTAVSTIKLNLKSLRAESPLILTSKLSLDNIEAVCQQIIAESPQLASRGVDLLAGAPPCQPYSTAGKRLSVQDERASGFDIMFAAIRFLRPSFFVIENVTGVLSAAVNHRPLNQRGPGFPALRPAEEYGSAFRHILRNLGKLCSAHGYCATWGVLNAADFGVPQKRSRLVIIGSKAGLSIWPTPTHSSAPKSGTKLWLTIKDALAGLRETKLCYEEFTGRTKEFIAHIPQGGNWHDLPQPLKARALGKAFKSWGGRSGFLRRLAWSEPAPTITQSPLARATLLCHPSKNRPLTVRECALVQGFPESWQFAGGVRHQYRQVGNATPIGLGKAIGQAILAAAALPSPSVHPSEVFCAQAELIAKIGARPRTKLNPSRMRPGSARESDRVWLGRAGARRADAKFLKVRPPVGNTKPKSLSSPLPTSHRQTRELSRAKAAQEVPQL